MVQRPQSMSTPRPPQGARSTFSEAQASAIRAKVAQYEGRLVWGGDWTDIPDETHFELSSVLH